MPSDRYIMGIHWSMTTSRFLCSAGVNVTKLSEFILELKDVRMACLRLWVYSNLRFFLRKSKPVFQSSLAGSQGDETPGEWVAYHVFFFFFFLPWSVSAVLAKHGNPRAHVLSDVEGRLLGETWQVTKLRGKKRKRENSRSDS